MQDTGSIIINRLVSRKFIIAILSLLSASLLCWNENISDGVFSSVIIATVGAYLAANVLQKNNEAKT